MCLKTLEPERLPLTEREQHSFTVYEFIIKSLYGKSFQVKCWILCNGVGNLMEKY